MSSHGHSSYSSSSSSSHHHHHHHHGSHHSSSGGGSSSRSSGTIRPSKPEDWEPYRDVISHLYSTMKLKDVMVEMQNSYAFKATEKQYKTQIKKWNLDTKYTKASEYVAMLKTQKKRERETPSKQTKFTLRGRPIDPKDIARFEKRAMKKAGTSWEEMADGEGDEYIEDLAYETPSPTQSVAGDVLSPTENLSPLGYPSAYEAAVPQAYLPPPNPMEIGERDPVDYGRGGY